MAKKKPSTDEIIKVIENIRACNNAYWMDILRVAMQHNPIRTRKLTKEISKNDKEITKWLGKL